MALLASVALVVSVIFGVTTASVQLSLGPHEARYAVTTDDLVTLDVGPLGTVQIDSPLPFTLGVRVTVEEIPADVSAVDPVRTLADLQKDFKGYVQFFSAPQASVADATRALVLDALLRSVIAFACLVAIGVAGRALLGAPRRAELAAMLAPRRRALVGSGLLVLMVAVTAVGSLNPTERRPTGQPASSVFDGTALEGARITGRLAGVIDTYGGKVIEAYHKNQEFYRSADRSLTTAFELRIAETRSRARALALLRVPKAEGPAPAAVPEPAKPVTLLMVSDIHCNVGMAPLIATAARLSGADVVLDGGDTTINGTAVEQYCVTTVARAVPHGIPIVVSDGNHDSREISAQERRAGMTVLAGKVVKVAGVRILGDRDPNETRIGEGTFLSHNESAAAEGERLAKVACDDGKVDLLLIHTPPVGDVALQSGCVPVQLSGHLHVRVGPAPFGQGVRYVNASTAGAALGQPTVGPLHGTAELTVFRFDPVKHVVVDYRLISVRPDRSAAVGPWVPFPTPAAAVPAKIAGPTPQK
ncbi:metallophosphoesterase family protein [Pengzhenrongella sp.]|uniref:metallophosphoesterase family protein n=1 Tax=Pengzhenrongella sp. TaxID=2888820 RepID=UPI002F94E82A